MESQHKPPPPPQPYLSVAWAWGTRKKDGNTWAVCIVRRTPASLGFEVGACSDDYDDSMFLRAFSFPYFGCSSVFFFPCDGG